MNRISQIIDLRGRDLFLFGARLSFGCWLTYVGLMKWLGGPVGFIGYIVGTFEKTWVPELLATGLGWIIIIAEPVIGLWLLAGIKPRWAWIGTAKLMFLVMFGKTILQDFATVANNWQYLVLALACAALTEDKKPT